MSQHSRGVHLATIAHASLIWDAYMEQEGDDTGRGMVRARVRFSSPEADRFFRTAVIIVESSWDDAVRCAKAFDERQLSALLRSVLRRPALLQSAAQRVVQLRSAALRWPVQLRSAALRWPALLRFPQRGCSVGSSRDCCDQRCFRPPPKACYSRGRVKRSCGASCESLLPLPLASH